MKEDVGEVELIRFVVGGDPRQRLAEAAAVEAVDAHVELMDRLPQLVARVLALDDLLELAIFAAYDPAVVAAGVVDGGEGGRALVLAVRVDDFAHGFARQQWRVAVDHEDVPFEIFDLLQRVGGAAGVALVCRVELLLGEMRRDLGMVRIDDDFDLVGARIADRVDDPIEHGAAAYRMQNLGGTRPHAGPVTGGQDDG